MYRTILVPLDGSPLAERALPFARTIAEAAGARLLLLRVAIPRDVPDSLTNPEIDESATDADAYLASLTPGLATTVPVQTTVLTGKPADRIVEETQAHPVGLVVMSTHGRSGLGAWVYGSVASAVLRHVAVPVLVIPRDCQSNWSERRPWRILVPLDGSDLSNAALVSATDLARLLGAEICLLSVVVPPTYVPIEGYPNPVAGAVSAGVGSTAEKFLYRIEANLRADGLIVSAQVTESGDPARTIADVARREQADVIAMASHGRSGLARLVMGGVATDVVRQATVPVLLVRPDRGHTPPSNRERTNHTPPRFAPSWTRDSSARLPLSESWCTIRAPLDHDVADQDLFANGAVAALKSGRRDCWLKPVARRTALGPLAPRPYACLDDL